MIFIVVIGGVGSTTGPIIGTLLFWVLRDQLADRAVWLRRRQETERQP